MALDKLIVPTGATLERWFKRSFKIAAPDADVDSGQPAVEARACRDLALPLVQNAVTTADTSSRQPHDGRSERDRRGGERQAPACRGRLGVRDRGHERGRSDDLRGRRVAPQEQQGAVSVCRHCPVCGRRSGADRGARRGSGDESGRRHRGRMVQSTLGVFAECRCLERGAHGRPRSSRQRRI